MSCFLITHGKSTSFFTYSWNFCMLFSIPLKIACTQLLLFGFFLEQGGNQKYVQFALFYIKVRDWQEDKKIPGFFIFYVKKIKKTYYLRNSDLRWPEIQLFQKQTFVEVLQNIAILKNFSKFMEKDLCQSLFLKHPASLKEDSGTSVFL